MAACNIAAAVAALVLVGVDAGRLWKKKIARHGGPRSLTACGTKGSSALSGNGVNISIVNGQPAEECEWRWQVGLRSTETGSPWCGGQLIHPEWVLTASHCADSPNFNVVAGEHRPAHPSGKEQSRWAVQVIQHPQYNDRTLDWDLALVRLETPMEINDCVGTVCLPTEGADVAPLTKCWITGWGTLSAQGEKAEVLQEAEVTILSNEMCKASNYTPNSITDAMICGQGMTPDGEVVDACQGDSGGPLVCESDGRWTVYGATSWGKGCAKRDYPGVWARVHEGLGWIEETMEANSGPVPTRPKCPDFARSPFPDTDGDCQCPWGKFCSASNSSEKDCPTTGPIGGYGGSYFLASCAECACYDY